MNGAERRPKPKDEEMNTTTTTNCPGDMTISTSACVDVPDFVVNVDGPVDIDFDGEPEVVRVPVQETRALCRRVPYLGARCRA